VTGCTLNMHLLRERFVAALPEILSDVRVLTMLNEVGEPLFVPPGAGGLEWKKPFVAREISSLLPRWEVGAWLVDPGMIASLARTTNLAVWLLVAVLLVTVATGGTVVLRTLSAEMRLARQKTTFVANVSHELKTPLTSIRLFAEMLLQHRQPDEARRDDYLRTMVSEAERLSRLVDNVLTFSRRDADNPDCIKERLNLADLVRETVEQLRPHLVLHGFSLRVEAPEMLPVQGHAEGLRQVLMNLLSNAEKYSEDRREVTVIVCSEGDEAVVEVADRGIGVPPSQAARIFEEFYRGDDSLTSTRRGTGLGLSIARHIARKHGGDVTFRPRDGGGSVFSLRIPTGDDATRKGAGA
jgi:signal transduction histidine kinase